jgi:hypothetical protein
MSSDTLRRGLIWGSKFLNKIQFQNDKENDQSNKNKSMRSKFNMMIESGTLLPNSSIPSTTNALAIGDWGWL